MLLLIIAIVVIMASNCIVSNLQIRVNAVNPTVVMTDMGKMAWSDPKKAGPMLSRIPLEKFVGK